MKWYQKTWFWLVLLCVLFVAGAGVLSVLGVITGEQLLKFWGGSVIMSIISFIAGRKSAPTVLVLVFVALLAGCTTTSTGGEKFDSCKAMRVAQASHQVAAGASAGVCALLPTKPEQDKCLAERAKYKAAGDAVLAIGGAILKACGL